MHRNHLILWSVRCYTIQMSFSINKIVFECLKILFLCVKLSRAATMVASLFHYFKWKKNGLQNLNYTQNSLNHSCLNWSLEKGFKAPATLPWVMVPVPVWELIDNFLEKKVRICSNMHSVIWEIYNPIEASSLSVNVELTFPDTVRIHKRHFSITIPEFGRYKTNG